MTREFFDVKDDDYTDDLSFVCWRLVYLYILFLVFLFVVGCFCWFSG